MQATKGRGAIAPHFLTSALDGVSGHRHATAALYPRYPVDRRLGGHQTWSGHAEARGKIVYLCQGSNHGRPVVQSVVRHYSD
jgi:hypothetical protein